MLGVVRRCRRDLGRAVCVPWDRLRPGDGDDRGELPAYQECDTLEPTAEGETYSSTSNTRRRRRRRRRRRGAALAARPASAAAIIAAVARRWYAVEVSFFAKVQNVGVQNISFDAGAYRTGVAEALSKPMADVFVTIDADDGEALGAAAPADAAGEAQATGQQWSEYAAPPQRVGACRPPCVPRPTHLC